MASVPEDNQRLPMHQVTLCTDCMHMRAQGAIWLCCMLIVMSTVIK